MSTGKKIAGLQRLADKLDPELFVDRHDIVWGLTPTGWQPRLN